MLGKKYDKEQTRAEGNRTGNVDSDKSILSTQKNKFKAYILVIMKE